MTSMAKKEVLRAKLGETRTALHVLLADLDEAAWETAVYSEQEHWSIADLLRHLTGAERSMTRLMDMIRDGSEGSPENFDLNYFNKRVVEKSKEKTPADLLAEMAENRRRLLQFIDSLTDADWEKEGRHGSMRIMSIEQICHLIADHEQSHMADIRRALAAS